MTNIDTHKQTNKHTGCKHYHLAFMQNLSFISYPSRRLASMTGLSINIRTCNQHRYPSWPYLSFNMRIKGFTNTVKKIKMLVNLSDIAWPQPSPSSMCISLFWGIRSYALKSQQTQQMKGCSENADFPKFRLQPGKLSHTGKWLGTKLNRKVGGVWGWLEGNYH